MAVAARALFVVAAAVLADCNRAARPNIVFLLVDDLGFNDVGYNNRTADGTVGGRQVISPHVDRLCDEGVKLMNYYVQEMCTPTRAALMTGRYPFRYGMTAFTIGADEPWGIPANETFFSQHLKKANYDTALFGKWHLGFFKNFYMPTSRGFDTDSGIWNALADHYTHEIGGGYDWHVNDTIDITLKGRYSGDLVRDDSVAFIRNHAVDGTTGQATANPFLLYVPFQECHSPYQVDQQYKDMYPHLAARPEMQTLMGMVTHTDEMIGDIYQALNTSGLLPNTVIFFSADNGGPGGQDGLNPRPSRFDAHYIDRNWPYRGQKHEIFEGGVHVAGFVHSSLLPKTAGGSASSALIHVVDWMPTILTLAGITLPVAGVDGAMPLDGMDQWPCITGAASCARKEVLLNIDLVCDSPGPSPGPAPAPTPNPQCVASCSKTHKLCNCHCFCEVCGAACGHGCYDKCAGDASPSWSKVRGICTSNCPASTTAATQRLQVRPYTTECPAPKAGLIVGDMKILAECYDQTTLKTTGKIMLFNLTSDPGEHVDLSTTHSLLLGQLNSRLEAYGAEAAGITPMGDGPPFQGPNYWCAHCKQGRPDGPNRSWHAWCPGPPGVPCP